MKKLLVICGPTATGKTALAIKLAKKFNGEIVSADSRQVYKGMDVGTGKEVPVNSKFEIRNSKLGKTIGFYEIDGVKVWLYDVVEPDYQFSVADYVQCANLVIEDIWKRKKLPILVGGTGFYIKAVVDGIETLGVKPDWKLREILGYQDIKILREMLEELDTERLERMNESDRSNSRRLIRAIEIARQKYTSEVSPRVKRGYPSTSEVKSFFIGLKAPYKELYERIDQRVDGRVEAGMGEEVKNLLKKGYNFENSVLKTTIGYKEWREKISNIQYPISNIIQKWKYDEHNYARRQMTWFKKRPNVLWFDIMEPDYKANVERVVKEWYDKK